MDIHEPVRVSDPPPEPLEGVQQRIVLSTSLAPEMRPRVARVVGPEAFLAAATGGPLARALDEALAVSRAASRPGFLAWLLLFLQQGRKRLPGGGGSMDVVLQVWVCLGSFVLFSTVSYRFSQGMVGDWSD